MKKNKLNGVSTVSGGACLTHASDAYIIATSTSYVSAYISVYQPLISSFTSTYQPLLAYLSDLLGTYRLSYWAFV